MTPSAPSAPAPSPGSRHERPACLAKRKLTAALAAAALLGGCAGVLQRVDFAPGTPRADVLARLGPPGRVVALADGERLQYSQQPAGQFAYDGGPGQRRARRVRRARC
jgi:ferric-dicitrate binding protein FerR (iron transport regulator)